MKGCIQICTNTQTTLKGEFSGLKELKIKNMYIRKYLVINVEIWDPWSPYLSQMSPTITQTLSDIFNMGNLIPSQSPSHIFQRNIKRAWIQQNPLKLEKHHKAHLSCPILWSGGHQLIIRRHCDCIDVFVMGLLRKFDSEGHSFAEIQLFWHGPHFECRVLRSTHYEGWIQPGILKVLNK